MEAKAVTRDDAPSKASTSAGPDNGRAQVQVTFRNVETPKRLANPEDVERGIVRHIFDVRAKDIDAAVLVGLDGPNPRSPNTNKKAIKKLKSSLMGETPERVGSFHLAHGGIRGLVSSFKKVDDTTYVATFVVSSEEESQPQDDGIANGLHTIAIVRDAIAEGDGTIPDNQFLTFTLVESVEPDLVPYIAEGLNTNLQVKEESLLDIADKFQPFKESVAGRPYEDEFAWHESDTGESDARELLAVLNALNPVLYPNEDRDKHPLESYEKQSKVVEAFARDEDQFFTMIPILNEALYLYDLIGSDAYERYKEAEPSGAPGRLAIMESKTDRNNNAKPDVWSFPFISEEGHLEKRTYRLSKGVRFAMLAAFRNFVEIDASTGQASWIGGFDAVKEAWLDTGGEMMVLARDVSKSVNYNPNAVGKNRPMWRQLHQVVGSYRTEKEMEKLREELAAMKADA